MVSRIIQFALFPIAFVVYVRSFFLPSYRLLRFGGTGYDQIPGWAAALQSSSFSRGIFNLEALFDRDFVCVALMFAANIFMLLSPVLVYRARPNIIQWVCLGFLVPVAATLLPIFVPVLDFHRDDWLVGYYVWAWSIIVTYLLVVVYSLSMRWSERAQARVAQL